MDSIAHAAFSELDNLCARDNFTIINEAEVDRFFSRCSTQLPHKMYSWAGPKIIDFVIISERINFYRAKTMEIARNFSYFNASYSFAMIKMGLGRCGEVNQMVINKFIASKINAILLAIPLTSEVDSNSCHVFSIILQKKDSSEMVAFDDLLKRDMGRITMSQLEEALPSSFVIDAYFREAGSIKTMSRMCPKLLKYVEEQSLNLCENLIYMDSLDPSAVGFVDATKANSDSIVKKLKSINFFESENLKGLRKIYNDEVNASKLAIRACFSEVEWKDSGDHLIAVDELGKLSEIYDELERMDRECLIIPTTLFPGKHLLIVNGNRER